MSQWFRFYGDALNDPKVQLLCPELFKAWVNLLCLASKHDGALPSVSEIAFALRISDNEGAETIGSLINAGLIDQDPLRPHNWNKRQYKSDVSNERVKRHRKRQCNVAGPVTVTFADTDTDTDTDTDSDTKQSDSCGDGARSSQISGSAPRSGRATQLPADCELADADRAFAGSKGLDDARIEAEFERFKNHAAMTGRRQKNWHAAWRNWVTSPFMQQGRPQTTVQLPRPGSFAARQEETANVIRTLRERRQSRPDAAEPGGDLAGTAAGRLRFEESE